MELTTYNHQRGRLRMHEVTFTVDNSAWLKYSCSSTAVGAIMDLKGRAIIQKNDYSYPIWLYEISRANIDHKKQGNSSSNTIIGTCCG